MRLFYVYTFETIWNSPFGAFGTTWNLLKPETFLFFVFVIVFDETTKAPPECLPMTLLFVYFPFFSKNLTVLITDL